MTPERIEELAQDAADYHWHEDSCGSVRMLVSRAIRTAVREALEEAAKACEPDWPGWERPEYEHELLADVVRSLILAAAPPHPG